VRFTARLYPFLQCIFTYLTLVCPWNPKQKSLHLIFNSGSHTFHQLRSRLLAATYNGLPKSNIRNSNNEAGRMELFANGDKDRDGALNYNEVGSTGVDTFFITKANKGSFFYCLPKKDQLSYEYKETESTFTGKTQPKRHKTKTRAVTVSFASS
jgi:hypothetical protein